VLSPEAAGELGKNYILICPSTDPAWTPLFVGAAGLILERGGALSHGAIVARELGLPAVVLENATHLFNDGEMLTLDASNGLVMRGETPVCGPAQAVDVASIDSPHIERCLLPPPVGNWERTIMLYGLIAALLWGLLLLAVWLVPARWLYDPLFAALDWMLWPLIRRLGMPGTVAAIAAFFALVPLLLQKMFVDNRRILTARDRAAQLRRLAKGLPANCARRTAMEGIAASVTKRVLGATFTSLAFVLGPMMLVFAWLPARLDPASWNAAPGQIVTVLAEVQGDWPHPFQLHAPGALRIDSVDTEIQTLPPIRPTLQALRTEWSQMSEVKEYPWELQVAAEQVHETLLASLDSFLAGEIPPQKLSWRIEVPEYAAGRHVLQLQTVDERPLELSLAFGTACPPVPAEVATEQGPIHTLKAVYPRSLYKQTFWTPLQNNLGLSWDLGWLGVYLLTYLPLMIVCKKVLRVA
jgi:pyruvate,water dikinase